MKITLDIIKSYDPCKSGIDKFEAKYPNYDGTLIDILNLDDVSYNDKMWLAKKVVDIKMLQLWSVECAESVVENYNKVFKNDDRVINCIKTIKLYLNQECSIDDMNSAESAARSAVKSAWSAMRLAAWSAARSALAAAESVALSEVLLPASESIARSAVGSALGSAAWSAVRSARSVARSVESAAKSMEKDQESVNLNILVKLLKENS